MLDAFLGVLVKKASDEQAVDKLAHAMESLPMEDLQKLASGFNTKQAFGCGEDEDLKWLSSYEDTPLYDKAMALQEELLKVQAARIESRMARPEPSPDFYQQEDMIRLHKRMLDLELSKLRHTEDAGGEEELEEEEAEVPPAEDKPIDEKAAAANFDNWLTQDAKADWLPKTAGIGGMMGGLAGGIAGSHYAGKLGGGLVSKTLGVSAGLGKNIAEGVGGMAGGMVGDAVMGNKQAAAYFDYAGRALAHSEYGKTAADENALATAINKKHEELRSQYGDDIPRDTARWNAYHEDTAIPLLRNGQAMAKAEYGKNRSAMGGVQGALVGGALGGLGGYALGRGEGIGGAGALGGALMGAGIGGVAGDAWNESSAHGKGVAASKPVMDALRTHGSVDGDPVRDYLMGYSAKSIPDTYKTAAVRMVKAALGR
jgi:hypothetical protein